MALMPFRTAFMSAMLAITKQGVCVGIITPCLVNFIMADMKAVQNCIIAEMVLNIAALNKCSLKINGIQA